MTFVARHVAGVGIGLGILGAATGFASQPEVARFSMMHAGQAVSGWTMFRPVPHASDII